MPQECTKGGLDKADSQLLQSAVCLKWTMLARSDSLKTCRKVLPLTSLSQTCRC